MSDRGSFCTEWMYCPECFAAVKPILVDGDNRWTMQGHVVIEGRMIAGFYGAELWWFEEYVAPELEKVACHKVKIAILAEKGSHIHTVQPFWQ